jgi:hypothetical protein
MATNESSKYKLSVTESTEYKLSVVDGTELQLSLNGATGATGPANVLTIGTVTTGETGVSAAASITGSSPSQVLNLTLPKGNTGATGPQGIQGFQGIQGPQGLAGDTYQTTSSTNLLIPAIGSTVTITVGTGLSYSTNQTVLISNSISNHIHAEIDSYNPTTGVMVAVVTDTEGSGTYSSWTVNLSGAVGAQGQQGIQGPQGIQGVQGIQGIQGAAGPNTVTTSTTTNLTGYIFGNGTNISGATAATKDGTPNTLVLRSAEGAATFSTNLSSVPAVTGINNSYEGGSGVYGYDYANDDGVGVTGQSTEGTGVYGVSEYRTGVRGYSTISTGVIGYSQNATGAESTSAANTGVTYHHKFGDSGNNRSAVERVRGWFVWFFGSFTGRLKTADITANREWTLPNASGTLTLDSHTHVISDVTGLQTALDDKSPAPASSFDLTYTGTLPPASIPTLTTTPLRDAMLGASGSQAATLRTGKWVTGISITGYSNPTLDNLTTLSSSDIVGVRDSFGLSNLIKLTTVSFPTLAAVGGSLNISNSPVLTSLSLPNLAAVAGGITFGSNSIATISMPSLAYVGGSFSCNNSTANLLTNVNFPSLTFVGSTFGVSSSSVGATNGLVTISFPSLVSVGGSFTLATGGFRSLTTASFPSLVSVGGSFFLASFSSNVPALTSVSFPALTSVGANFTAGLLSSLTTANFPSLASVGSSFTIDAGNAFTTLLIGSGLKHINGDFSSGLVNLDRNNAWSANTYYPSYTSFTAPASAFSSTTTGTTCTVTLAGHGLQTNDIVTVSGLTGSAAATHNFNAAAVVVTRISSSQFSYTITATSQLAAGTATIQRLEVAVTPVTKNGRKYICTTAGTSGATEPTWPTTVGNTVTDGTAIWTCSELSLSNIFSRLDALDGTNQTTTYGANRFINFPINTASQLTVNSITTASGTATITTATNHGITTGTQVVIAGCTGTAQRYNGVWTVTSTGATTLTATVPTDLNSVSGTGVMRLLNTAPQYTGITPIAPTAVVGAAHDSHTIINSNVQLRDSDGGTSLPVFPAGIYTRNGTTNGFPKYSCAENGWDMWYDTTTKRWANTPSGFTGNTTAVGDYLFTAQSVQISSTSAANPAVITSSTNHNVTVGVAFTVVIEGCSNAALNGSWTATATTATAFTIPVSGAAGATTNSGTIAILNQTLQQGRLMNTNSSSPIQGVQQTITRNSHGFSTGDFIHFYGAGGTHAISITDSNSSATSKSTTSAITVTDGNTFTCVRYSNIQPFIGTYSLATNYPHMRRTTVNDVAYYTALKLRARGVAVNLVGTTGV